MVADEFLKRLSESNCCGVEYYADNTAIMQNGKFPQMFSEVLQIHLGVV
jgi:hypothetical protein